jgi:hypothetical protein
MPRRRANVAVRPKAEPHSLEVSPTCLCCPFHSQNVTINPPITIRQAAEHDKACDLPDDEKRGDIQSDDASKLNGRKVKAKAIAEEKPSPGKEEPTAQWPRGLTHPHSDNSVSCGFQ